MSQGCGDRCGLIAGVVAHQQPSVGLGLIRVHALPLLEELAELLFRLGQALHGGLAEPVRGRRIVLPLQLDPAQKIFAIGITVRRGFLQPAAGFVQVARDRA